MMTDVAELLRSMPDLEPPADGWQRLTAQRTRRNRGRWGGGLAVAASVVVAIIMGALYMGRVEFVTAPADQSTVRPIIVSAPAIPPGVRAVDSRVRALQQRSQYMERLLRGLPPRGQVARADTAGVIAELEDRIATVDYQLNRSGLNRSGLNRSGVDRRLDATEGVRYEPADAPELWHRRVEFMDQLVRAHYAQTGANGF
jgi:hypothetical protein